MPWQNVDPFFVQPFLISLTNNKTVCKYLRNWATIPLRIDPLLSLAALRERWRRGCAFSKPRELRVTKRFKFWAPNSRWVISIVQLLSIWQDWSHLFYYILRTRTNLIKANPLKNYHQTKVRGFFNLHYSKTGSCSNICVLLRKKYAGIMCIKKETLKVVLHGRGCAKTT